MSRRIGELYMRKVHHERKAAEYRAELRHLLEEEAKRTRKKRAAEAAAGKGRRR